MLSRKRWALISDFAKQLVTSAEPRYRIANAVLRPFPEDSAGLFRGHVYRLAGFEVGHGTYLMRNLNVVGGRPHFARQLRIGRDVVIGRSVTINVDDEVTIGDRVVIGPFVKIYTSTHEMGGPERRCLPEVVTRPVAIGDGAWVAMNSTVLPGVVIGPGCVIAAGSVVTADTEANALYGGVPARKVRSLGAAA
jgi:maltose O-acetyltransferase